MSADWFCKIGERKVGPLSGQQLKTIVAKGQLKPEHLVRRGSEGPWVAAGRIKGLFSDGPTADAQTPDKKPPPAIGKPLPKGAAKPSAPPTARATNLPTAAEAPAPPPADIPQELLLGEHHKHHVELNVDSLNIETTPVAVSRRRVRAGLQGMKKEERRKLTVMLMCLIGGGTAFGLIVFIWAIASGKFSSPKREEPKELPAVAQATDSGKKIEKMVTDNKPAQGKEDVPKDWPSISIETVVGNVVVKILKPTRGEPPEGATTKETDVLIVPVRLNLKVGSTKQVGLTSWTDDSLKKKVLLKDDQNKSYALLDQVVPSGSDGKMITEKWSKVQLVFQAPADTKLKYLHLTLPAAAFHVDGNMIYYEINPSDITSAKSARSEKVDESTESGDGDRAEGTSKNNQK
ncbi:MAG: DUF4339 domain-containing protein [Thermoguttaceae bacterium]|jgi:hypothetical protein